MGYFNTLVLDSQGYLHLGYFQETSDMVWHAHNDSGEWLFDYVLGGVGNGIDVTLALDSKDNPHYGYRVKGKKLTPELKYVYWNGSRWVTVRGYGSYVADTDISMALDPEDHPHFSYLDGYSYTVMYATYTPQKGWEFQTVDNGNAGCRAFPIAVDSGGIPHLAYQSEKGGLRYATLQEGVWQRVDVDPAAGAGVYSDLTIAPDGSVHIAYYNANEGSLQYAYQGEDGAWQIETVDSGGDAGQFPSIKVDANGEVYIAYYDAVQTALKFAHRRQGQWSVETVDNQGNVGRYASLVVDPHGTVYIAYLDRDREDSKLAQGFRVGP
ncbi:MAG: hypothetical protein D6794_08535 [Deltaproteobacteria bacterium]|nr:MAG: hypothetical protein D6794_08535 [Deltaproteobacteria bacterium]